MLVEEMTIEQRKALLEILRDISVYTSLTSIGLVTVEGDALAFFSDVRTDLIDSFSAISASVSTLGDVVSGQLAHGALKSVFISGERGFTVFYIKNPFILIGGSESNVSSVGLVDRIFRKYITEIPKIFEGDTSISEEDLSKLF